MKLPPKEFAGVLASLRALSTRNEPTNRRGTIRMQVTARVQIHLIDHQRITRSFTALTVDLSITGAQIMLTVPVNIGQVMLITLPRKNGAMHIRSVVMHRLELADEMLRIGVAFESDITPQAMAELISTTTAEEDRLRKAILD